MGKRAANSIESNKVQINKTTSPYIDPIVQANFTYIQTQVNLLWEVHYIKYRMGNQS